MRTAFERAQRAHVGLSGVLGDPVRMGGLLFIVAIADDVFARVTSLLAGSPRLTSSSRVLGAGSIALICLAGAIVLVIALRRPSKRMTVLLLILQAAIVWTPLAFEPFRSVWVNLGGMLAAALLLGLPPRLAWPLYAAACVADTAIFRVVWPHQATAAWLGVLIFTDLNVGLSSFALRRLADLAESARNAQRELIPLELARDQVRTARALRAALGGKVAGIAQRTQRISGLLETGSEAARRELDDVVEDARGVLQSARRIAGGLRPLSLAGELSAAREVLASTGIEVVVTTTATDDGTPSKAVDALLAMALRRSVMTLVRHSPDAVCLIGVHGPGRLTVAVRGTVPDALRSELHEELGDLAARASRLGGVLNTPTGPSEPVLTIRMPVAAKRSEAPSAPRTAASRRDASVRLARGMLIFTAFDYVTVAACSRAYFHGGHWAVAGPLFIATVPLAIAAGWQHSSPGPSRGRDAALIALGVVSVLGFFCCAP
jgi:two-component system sensor histidine kinase DesK